MHRQQFILVTTHKNWGIEEIEAEIKAEYFPVSLICLLAPEIGGVGFLLDAGRKWSGASVRAASWGCELSTVIGLNKQTKKDKSNLTDELCTAPDPHSYFTTF